jgi:hypothetical protein
VGRDIQRILPQNVQMTLTDSPRARPSRGGSAALVLVLAACGFAIVALPGALVWLSIWLPAIGVPDEGIFLILANVVTIPAALVSWVLASAGAVTAVAALMHGRRRDGGSPRDRRAVLALRLGIPGAALGTISTIAVVLLLGLSLGIIGGPDDHRREVDAQAVAAHLSLPKSAPQLIARCEHKNGITNQERWISVLEPQNQFRVEQIQSRLRDYTPLRSFDPPSPTAPQKVYFVGTDTRGNDVRISVDYVDSGTALDLGCGRVRTGQPEMLTQIVLQNPCLLASRPRVFAWNRPAALLAKPPLCSSPHGRAQAREVRRTAAAR